MGLTSRLQRGGSLVMFPDRPQPRPSRPELLRKTRRMEVLRSRRKLLRSRKKLLRRRRKRRKTEPESSKKANSPSDDEEDWTVVSDKKAAEDSTPESLYPDLTETPSAPPSTASHPDPRIQVALQAMMNMGFTNDGGWLTSLLEAKNGDIGKVLDILQPVKK